jgi:ABC-type multidrug transport system ATPase subunit
VNNLTFSIKEGEIFTLLGHNGAGKTTAISMLSGMLQASSGDAFVYGNSIK